MDVIMTHLSSCTKFQKELIKSNQPLGDMELKFVEFCVNRNEDPSKVTAETAIEFRTAYYNAGVGYRSVNSAESVLSSIIKPADDVLFGWLKLVCRFMKGVFNLRPALPRYTTKLTKFLIIIREIKVY